MFFCNSSRFINRSSHKIVILFFCDFIMPTDHKKSTILTKSSVSLDRAKKEYYRHLQQPFSSRRLLFSFISIQEMKAFHRYTSTLFCLEVVYRLVDISGLSQLSVLYGDCRIYVFEDILKTGCQM